MPIRKLTPDQVRECRRIHALRKSLPTTAQMARDAGVTPAAIRTALRFETFKRVR